MEERLTLSHENNDLKEYINKIEEDLRTYSKRLREYEVRNR